MTTVEAPRRAELSTEQAEKLYAARLFAAQKRPYLATALFALRPIVSWSVPTMAVDRFWRCYVSPAFVTVTPMRELAAVWVHEVSHLLRDHHGRGERLAAAKDLTEPGDRLRMNIAADLEINDDAYGDGLPTPTGAPHPGMLALPAGRLMEEYLPQISIRRYSRHLIWLDCGSGADGLDRAWELGPDGAHGLDEQERALVRHRVAQGIIGHPGSAPAGWRRWATKVVHPPQQWRRLLGAAIRSAASAPGVGEDYVYSRPARRSASLPGVILPSLRRRPPRVTVVVDTSGSVSDSELGSALLEVAAIARAVGGGRDMVRVLSCDAATHVAGPVCAAEGISLIGGGGTDMRSGLDQALTARPAPDVVVVLTDGQTPWPGRKPPCRTVVGLFRRPVHVDEDNPDYHPEGPPDWARVVTIG
ncbi:VWA-like domain-containing protein [Actinoplanes sp. NEAU-A12]|uniref:VWA-like domain-containing protein n=1 Tax=Actinoplanes sandaracinus TaxID=3045177 RepID=A0ABT6WC75_9ACTN|nr:VWA-like domain-containing protein [Actinoplanes sandaracinus]MDI6097323.1 VWA-like domain-containing protein [Actinoplanes sandaracinus]